MSNVYKIKDLNQARLLSDPLKLRLLQAFADSPKTTKQVAAELGESVTKLYRHVDALHDAGLLLVTAERRKRGTTERTFRAVAQRFEADHSLFSGEGGDEGAEAAREMLRISETEILEVLARAGNNDDERALVMRFRGRANPKKIAELRATLDAWLESLPEAQEPAGKESEEFGGLIAFYRID
jgi:predicted ArsR family transcriptional regulator